MDENQVKRLRCSECGIVLDPSKVSYNYTAHEILCHHCWNEHLEVCAYCRQAYIDTNVQHAEGYTICSNCFNEHSITCKKCGIIARNGRTDRELDDLCYDCETLQLYHNYLDKRDFSKQLYIKINYDELREANSTLLMSRLRHSYGETPTDSKKNPYDVLLVYIYNTIFVIVYVLPKRLREVSIGGCTMSEFRKKRFWEWLECFKNRESRMIPIRDQFTLNAWINPYRLKAMTDSDKHFYKRFEGGELVEEGNEYGDTTSFLIIGTLTES